MKWYIDRSGAVVKSGTGLYKLSTSYSKGGFNACTSEPESRGYFVHFTPGVDRTEKNGFVTERTTLFAGFKVCLKQVARASAKAEKDVDQLVGKAIDAVSRIVSGAGDEQAKSDAVGRLFLGMQAA